MKLLARKFLKAPLLLPDLAKPATANGYAFMIYHSVAGDLNFELDLPVALFRRQMEFLARAGWVISYDEAVAALYSKNTPTQNVFVLTFDDGFANFYENVFPVLKEFQIPAMLFVTTGFVENGIAYSIQRHRDHAEAKPVTWEMLGEMAQSKLVTLGAHTHTHPNLAEQSQDRVIEELAKPLALFRERLGLEVRHFAYPKALWNHAVEKLVAEYYDTAVISGGRKATPERFNPHRIPRIPIRRSDGWLFFRAKARGWLAGEEALYVRLRKLHAARCTRCSPRSLWAALSKAEISR